MTVRNQTVHEEDGSEIVRIPVRHGVEDPAGPDSVYEVRGPYGKVVCRVETLEEAKRRLARYLERVRKASGESDGS